MFFFIFQTLFSKRFVYLIKRWQSSERQADQQEALPE